jgi:hypothetical protein
VSSRSRSRRHDADAVRATRSRARWARRRDGAREHFAQVRADDVVVFAAITLVSVWGWIAFTLDEPGDGAGGPGTAAIAVCLGSFVLLARRWYDWRRHPDDPRGRHWQMPLLLLPIVSNPVLLLAVTLIASKQGFRPGADLPGLIGATALLGIAGLFSSLLIVALLVWPVLLLVDAVFPPAADTRGLSRMSRTLSRGELAGAAILIFAAVAFSCALGMVYPDAPAESMRGRMAQRLIAWVTLQGEPVPSILALFFALVLVGATVATRWRPRADSQEAATGR